MIFPFPSALGCYDAGNAENDALLFPWRLVGYEADNAGLMLGCHFGHITCRFAHVYTRGSHPFADVQYQPVHVFIAELVIYLCADCAFSSHKGMDEIHSQLP